MSAQSSSLQKDTTIDTIFLCIFISHRGACVRFEHAHHRKHFKFFLEFPKVHKIINQFLVRIPQNDTLLIDPNF